MTNSDKMNQILANFNQLKHDLPQIIANDAQKFFGDSFKNQGFTNGGLHRWAKRKSNKDEGRAILVKSGVLRRAVMNSARVISFDKIQFVVGLPYASVHNDGGTFKRKAHVKTSTSSRAVTHTGIFTGSQTTQRTHKIAGQHGVGANTATYPKRQFMGESKELREMIRKKINFAVKNILKG